MLRQRPRGPGEEREKVYLRCTWALRSYLGRPLELPTSYFLLPTSHVPRTSYFLLPTSHVPRPTSHVPRPTSHFLLPTPYSQVKREKVYLAFEKLPGRPLEDFLDAVNASARCEPVNASDSSRD